MTDIDITPRHLTLPALFLTFFLFGLLAFGGPVAQIAMVRQALVEEERWIAPARFNRLVAGITGAAGTGAHATCWPSAAPI